MTGTGTVVNGVGVGGSDNSPPSNNYYRTRLGKQKLCLMPGINQYSFNRTLASLTVKSPRLFSKLEEWLYFFLTPQPLMPVKTRNHHSTIAGKQAV